VSVALCDHGSSAPLGAIAELPVSQSGVGRHRCAICAFEEGRRIGFEAGMNETSFEEGRKLGYEAGFKAGQDEAIRRLSARQDD
jgi:hypothetical protein